MAKRRTKKQKQNAKVMYSYSPEIKTLATKKEESKKVRLTSSTGIMLYDNALLKKDMMKTLLLSGLILAAEILIYYFIK